MDCSYTMTTYQRNANGSARWGTAKRKSCPNPACRLINGTPYCSQHAPSKKQRPFTIEALPLR